ncbi:uncharacterized protein METZ01_LOCUS328230 [marine metagenome]|uniref:Uncharacterized protein n=1 Tax=marine metagenome TaxID=408172 RepID=A0A382PQ69_9ZZZZ
MVVLILALTCWQRSRSLLRSSSRRRRSASRA